MKAIAALLIAATGLLCTGYGKASATTDLDSFLTNLPSTFSAAGSPDQLRAALSTAPPEVSRGPGNTLRFPAGTRSG